MPHPPTPPFPPSAAPSRRDEATPDAEGGGRVVDDSDAAAGRDERPARAVARQMRNHLGSTLERTLDYVEREPLKAVAIAAGSGCLLALAVGCLLRPSR